MSQHPRHWVERLHGWQDAPGLKEAMEAALANDAKPLPPVHRWPAHDRLRRLHHRRCVAAASRHYGQSAIADAIRQQFAADLRRHQPTVATSNL